MTATEDVLNIALATEIVELRRELTATQQELAETKYALQLALDGSKRLAEECLDADAELRRLRGMATTRGGSVPR